MNRHLSCLRVEYSTIEEIGEINFILRPTNAIHRSARAATADAHKKMAGTRLDYASRRCETVGSDSFQERLSVVIVVRAVARNVPNSPKRPIEQKQAAAILRRKL